MFRLRQKGKLAEAKGLDTWTLDKWVDAILIYFPLKYSSYSMERIISEIYKAFHPELEEHEVRLKVKGLREPETDQEGILKMKDSLFREIMLYMVSENLIYEDMQQPVRGFYILTEDGLKAKRNGSILQYKKQQKAQDQFILHQIKFNWIMMCGTIASVIISLIALGIDSNGTIDINIPRTKDTIISSSTIYIRDTVFIKRPIKLSEKNINSAKKK